MKAYSTFNQTIYDSLTQPMFFGENVNVARYDVQKYPVIEKLIEQQLAFFWRPEEVDLSRDRIDFSKMPDHEKHIFLSNLKYQILLDSVQGRSPNMALLPVASLPELETWIETWSFSETIHSRSYTHIIRNLVTNPGEVFDQIMTTNEIIERATSVTELYDQFIHYVQMVQTGQIVFDSYFAYVRLVRLLVSIFILEGVRFYVSFACSFAFGERKMMEGNAKIIKLIARDEALHKQGTQYIIGRIRAGKEGEEALAAFNYLKEEGELDQLFEQALQQEQDWADYLFKDGSMIGLNATILKQYVAHVTSNCRKQLGLEHERVENPLPWMNHWLYSDNVQTAPQETENSSYLTGQVSNDLAEGNFGSIEL